jgi:hypothetical protein
MIGETAPAVARLQPRQVAVTATECPQDPELICNTGRLTAAPLLHLSVEPIGHVLGDVARKRLARVGAQDLASSALLSTWPFDNLYWASDRLPTPNFR